MQQADGSWVLNGEKRWIGNGCRGDVLTTFARAEVDGKDSHIALILEKGMEGFDQSGQRYETMGLQGNHLRPAALQRRSRPAGERARRAGRGLPDRDAGPQQRAHRPGNRLASGWPSGCSTWRSSTSTTRRQFGKPLAEFDMVEDKIGWMVSYLFGLESMAYLTTGMIDSGIEDYSVESAIAKVSGTEFVWYQANRALQLAGGQGYMRDQPYEQILRDIRIFPIFEGANDVMRSFIALCGAQAAGRGARGARRPRPRRPDRLDRRDRRVCRAGASSARCGPDRISRAHDELASLADSVGDQVKRLRGEGEGLLRKHGKGIVDEGLAHRRYCDALSDIYAQIAVLSRVTSIFEEQGVEASGQERYIAETFCTARRARAWRARLTGSTATTTIACIRSRRSPTSAARTATRCSRTESPDR